MRWLFNLVMNPKHVMNNCGKKMRAHEKLTSYNLEEKKKNNSVTDN